MPAARCADPPRRPCAPRGVVASASPGGDNREVSSAAAVFDSPVDPAFEPVIEPAMLAVSATDPAAYVAPVELGAFEPLLDAVPELGLAAPRLAVMRVSNDTTVPPSCDGAAAPFAACACRSARA